MSSSYDFSAEYEGWDAVPSSAHCCCKESDVMCTSFSTKTKDEQCTRDVNDTM